jgi:hypothetical protein
MSFQYILLSNKGLGERLYEGEKEEAHTGLAVVHHFTKLVYSINYLIQPNLKIILIIILCFIK